MQLHGRIGMTWEHPAHLYLGRAKTSQVALGTGPAPRRDRDARQPAGHLIGPCARGSAISVVRRLSRVAPRKAD